MKGKSQKVSRAGGRLFIFFIFLRSTHSMWLMHQYKSIQRSSDWSSLSYDEICLSWCEWSIPGWLRPLFTTQLNTSSRSSIDPEDWSFSVDLSWNSTGGNIPKEEVCLTYTANTINSTERWAVCFVSKGICGALGLRSNNSLHRGLGGLLVFDFQPINLYLSPQGN